VIRSLKPNVSQDEALRVFRGGGIWSLLVRMRRGALQRVAAVYVPFRVYRVEYSLNKEKVRRIFAMDAVDGSLDLFEFREAPKDEELIEMDSKNRLEATLSADAAYGILREKALRIIFQQGFFKWKEESLKIEEIGGEIFLPYWLGFYGGENALRCRVLDAVRRRIEGAKATAFFEQWLMAESR
jgi:hypothetical protein